MYRGTTPTLKIHTPYDAAAVVDGFITIKQGAVQIDIRLDDPRVRVEDQMINVSLTQEDTLQFTEARTSKLQLRLKLNDGIVVASNIMALDVQGILKGGEI